MKISSTKIAEGSWGKNYTPGRLGNIIGWAVHNTGTLASAENNLTYFASRYVGASAHLFVNRDGGIHMSVRLGDTAWAVGTTSGYKHATARNSNTINVEMVDDGRGFSEQQIAALQSIHAYIKANYGDNVANNILLRHFDVTGKSCPAFYVDNTRWANLKSRITSGAGGDVTPPATNPPVSGGDMQTSSIVTYLNSIGKDSSFSNRAKLAVQYGIVSSTSQYTGTAAQNTALLNAMRKSSAPAPTPPPASSWFVTTRSATKWRSGPGTNYGVVKSYDAGARIEVSGKVTGQDPYGDGRNQWYKSKVSGLYCWSGTVD